MIVFPDANYDSFISEADADTCFESRLHSEDYVTADPNDQEAALLTAFRSLMELDITIDPTDSTQVKALKDAQCEQALHEIKDDLDSQNLNYFALQGIKAIVTSYQKNEIDYAGGRIESSDKKILIPLKGLTINPNTNGKIQIDDTEYEIKHVETDPTGALCTVQARL